MMILDDSLTSASHHPSVADKTDKLGSGVNVSAALRVEEDGSCTDVATDDGGDGYRANIIGHNVPQPSIEAVDLIGIINKQEGTGGRVSFSGEFNGHNNSTPALELCLKRPINSLNSETKERGILNHSNASAFSW